MFGKGLFRKRGKLEILVPEPAAGPKAAPVPFESLPYIDNETLESFLADPCNIELLPVDPYEYRQELRRLIVSAFFHEASSRAKAVEGV